MRLPRVKRPFGAKTGRSRDGRISPLLLGILAAIIAALLAIITSTEVLLGVCIASLGALLGLVYDLYRRMERRIEAEENLGALLAAVDHADWLLKELRYIATSAVGALDEDWNRNLFEELVRSKVRETKAYMQDLRRGRISLPVNADVTPMSNQIELVKRTVMATTIAKSDTEWWHSEEGRDYLDRNRLAIARKVRIERIILWDRGEGSPRLAKMIEMQRAARVELLFVKRSEVNEERLLTTMAIYDEASFNEVVSNSDGEDIYAEYYLDPAAAKQAVARYKKLRGFATRDIPEELVRGLQAAPEEAPKEAPKKTPKRASSRDGNLNATPPKASA